VLTDDAIDAIAQEHVRNTYPPDCEILHREVRSDPDGIYFVANRRGDDPYVGSGGFFVTRVSGEVWTFGSGQIAGEGLDYWLRWHSEGWRVGEYRLTVLEVKSPDSFARLLHQRRVGYRFREVVHGTVWTREVAAHEEEILDRLAALPCTFLVSADDLRAILPVLRRDGLARVEYRYVGTAPGYDWRPENNTPDQLGPQWDWPRTESKPEIICEVGGLPDETGVALCVYGTDLDPDEVTRLLGCGPTRAGRRGDPTGERSSRKHGVWILEVRGEGEDVEALTRRLLDRLPANPDIWSQLCARFDAKLNYGIHLEAWNRGFELSRDLVQRFGQLGLRVGFDIYAHGDGDW
jgi:hypothetical protein